MTKDLELGNVFARWDPHMLDEIQKIHRVQELSRVIDDIKVNVFIIDEMWLFAQPLPERQNVRNWVSPYGDRPTLPRRINIRPKILHHCRL